MVQKAAWANLLQLHFSFGVTTTFFNECTRLLVFVWEALKWIWDLRHLSCQQAAQSLVNYICHSQQYTINAQPWHSKCCHLEELELKTLGNFGHWLSNHDLNLPSAYPALNFKRLVRSCRLKGNTRAGSSGAGGFIPAKEKIPPPPPAQRGCLSCSQRKKEIAKYSNERKRKMKETKSEGRNRGVSKAFVPRLRQKNSKWHRRPSTVRRAVRCGECFSWNRSPLPSFFWRIRLVISNPL